MKISLSQLRQLIKEAKEEVADDASTDIGHPSGAPDVYEPSEGNYFDIVLKKLQKGEPLDHDPATIETVIQILNDKSARASIQREALESLNFMNFVLAAMIRDPFVTAETTEFVAAWLWRKYWPKDKVPALGKELLILLRERLKYAIAYSSEVANLAVRGRVPIRTALAAASKRFASVAAKKSAAVGLRQVAKTVGRRLGRYAAAGPASIALGAADVAILSMEHLSLEALRASEYQSTLIKQMIDVHRNQYLYRKNDWRYDPDFFGGGEGETLPVLIDRLEKVIKEIETSLELRNNINTNYTIMAPLHRAPGSSELSGANPVRGGGNPSWETARRGARSTAIPGEKRAESSWWEMETDIPGEKSEDKNFEIAQRKLSDIPRKVIQDLRNGVIPDPLPKNWKKYKYLYDKYHPVLMSSQGRGRRWMQASAWIKVPDASSGKMQIWIAGQQNDDIGLFRLNG